ncbi:MAG TPA: hypothetical protein VHE81_16260 [Lacipirellulaceae bacterium]|nr:hypothetical protein [Lacipirellulaceae bacterium]
MTHSALVSVLGREFDDFLFAPIGEDRNDMPLSVLSALARLDIDPWQEADKLARLPRETATQRLASLIATLPNWPLMQPDPGTIAARLIGLLPCEASPRTPSRGTSLGAGDMTKLRAGLCIYAVFIIFMMAAQWIVVSHEPPGPLDNTHAAASGTVFPRAPPPNPGQ